MDAVEEGWEQTLCCVPSIKISVTTILRAEKSPTGAELVCSRCAREREGVDFNGGGEGPGLVVNGGMLEEVEQFCYLGDVVDCEAGVEGAV